MPAEALPFEPIVITGSKRLRREYRDPLGRPMTGSVVITGRAQEGQGYIPVPVRVDLVAGVLEADLPPDTYELEAKLRTVDDQAVLDRAVVVHG